jgi:hypothetical protein
MNTFPSKEFYRLDDNAVLIDPPASYSLLI